MEKTSEKHVIGLTGNADKTRIVEVLTRLGARLIDADELVYRAISSRAPGYRLVLENFGQGLLGQNGEIDRVKLDQVLAADPSARSRFETLLGPILLQATQTLIRHADRRVVVVKDRNLAGHQLDGLCEIIWAVTASQEQVSANVVFSGDSSPEELAAQVTSAWRAVTHRWLGTASLAPVDVRADEPVEVPASKPEPEKEPVTPVRVEPVRTESLPPRVEPVEEKKSEAKSFAMLRLLLRRGLSMATTLLVIAYLTSLGLILAERGRQHLPAQPLNALWEALTWVMRYLFQHPASYFWRREDMPAIQLVSMTLGSSAVLLLLSLGVALLVGMALGVTAALSKRKLTSTLMMLVSVLGISTPSFLLAMLFWVVNINFYKTTGLQALPSVGFGFDAHLVLPVLVLSMRPLAQIAQVSYVSLSDVLRQDYIRTAKAKGLSWRLVRDRHALRNVMIPILTTLGTSLRFSLASLPVVELFFAWPGVGLTLLQAINGGETTLVIDLILSLGLFFLFVNLAIEVFFPLIDARLRTNGGTEEREDHQGFAGWWQGVFEIFKSWMDGIRERLSGEPPALPPLPQAGTELSKKLDKEPANTHRRWVLRSLISNPALIFGSLLVAGLVFLVFFGGQLTQASPYETHGVMMIDGTVFAPPFKPSATFPWGSDYVGRDMQALVLSGAKQTLALALFGMLARLALGVVLGALAGWQRGGWLDRLVSGAIGVWAAFPLTLFAMLMIQALGIQQGMWVFVVTLSVVGWGEVAQFVRSQVVSLKPQLYIESARSVGARSDQIMIRHVVPNLVGSLIVLAVLEMGGILMLLAELGYLNIFLGGGFSAMIGEVGRMQAVIVQFSDVPEWAAIIANVRQWWRSYPWMALYPGLAFFLSIMAFNLMGEGLRRFFEDTQANLSRLFNRYTLMAGVAIMVGLTFWFQSTAPLGVYRAEAAKLDEQRIIQDIEKLSSPEFAGRETGTAGAEKAAEYIQQRMIDIGLLPGGQGSNYIQEQVVARYHLVDVPKLEILDEQGNVSENLVYRRDFAELMGPTFLGDTGGPVVGLAFGAPLDLPGSDPYQVASQDLKDAVVIIRKADLNKFPSGVVAGTLVVADEPLDLEYRDVFQANSFWWQRPNANPVMVISQDLAERLLASAGSSLEALDQAASELGNGELFATGRGEMVHMSVIPTENANPRDEKYYNVIGVLPGKGSQMGLDSQVIMVSAYYDGLGVGPEGTFYPGANDNASGVAMMLEFARLMKESAYQPDKTIIFVAWAGGERGDSLSVTSIMNARLGFDQLSVEAVVELSGVGAGSEQGVALGQDSSYRLVKLFQEAAGKFGVETTTRGRGPHYGKTAQVAFGGRSALTLSVSANGSDYLAHTPYDTVDTIKVEKLREVGRPTLLTLFVLSRETEY